jgi:hypothetical protein
MRVYISGAIHLRPQAAERFFRQYAVQVSLAGHEPVVPHDIKAAHANPDDECAPAYSQHDGHTAACWMLGDLRALLQCNALLMIGNWEDSVGAEREHSVACWTGIPIYYSIDTLPRRTS